MNGADVRDGGRCAETDPELFFPDKGGSARAAKSICMTCEVRVPCLEDALANDERFGVWGGTTERDRRKIRKDRAAEQATPNHEGEAA